MSIDYFSWYGKEMKPHTQLQFWCLWLTASRRSCCAQVLTLLAATTAGALNAINVKVRGIVRDESRCVPPDAV